MVGLERDQRVDRARRTASPARAARPRRRAASATSLPPGVYCGSMPGRDHADTVGAEAEVVRPARACSTPTSVTIGVRRYSGGASFDSTKLPNAARRGGSVICHISACTWCSHVDVRGARPQRREERHAVPDLDETVAPAVPAHHLAERGPGEHEVAAGLADHAVAVAPRHLRVPRGVRRAHGDLDARFGPERGDVRRRAARSRPPRDRRGHATRAMLTRCRPASAAMSPSLAISTVWSRLVMRDACYWEVRAALGNVAPLVSAPMARLTGERPMVGVTPDSLLAFHDAGYREMSERVGPGTVLDVGCGVGDQTARLAGIGRLVIGVDYDAQTAIDAAARMGTAGPALRGDGRRAHRRPVALDRLGVLVAHHRALRRTRAARRRAGPRRHRRRHRARDHPEPPADFENPFHVSLFDGPELESLLALFFHDVTVQGLEGSPELHDDFAERRASGEKFLPPRSARPPAQGAPQLVRVGLRARAAGRSTRRSGSERTGIGSGLDESHFFITDEIAPTTPGLFAVARRPATLTAATSSRAARVGLVELVGDGCDALGDRLQLRRQPLVDHDRPRRR